MGPEYYDWEGKMAAYKKEIEREDLERNQRMEKANNLEKGWELLRLCRDFVKTNTADWTDRQEDNKLQKLEEERKTERLRKCEKERGRFEM